MDENVLPVGSFSLLDEAFCPCTRKTCLRRLSRLEYFFPQLGYSHVREVELFMLKAELKLNQSTRVVIY